jgi:hypothetical protein
MFCETKIVQCIYLDEHILLADDDFYDGIHTNPNGSKKNRGFFIKLF